MNIRNAYMLIFLTYCLFMVSCNHKVNRSFKLTRATLQQIQIDSAFSKDTVYYLLDLVVIPQDPFYFQVPLTGILTYGKGIKEKINSVDIIDSCNVNVNDLFSSIPQKMRNKISKNTELMLPLPELTRVIGTDSCVSTTIDEAIAEINSIRRDLMYYTELPKGEIHFCRLFSYPRNKHFPYTIKIITTKSEIYGTVNNKPIKGLIYNQAPLELGE